MEQFPMPKQVLHPTQVETGQELMRRAATLGVSINLAPQQKEVPDTIVTTANQFNRVLSGLPLYPGKFDFIIFDESHHMLENEA